MGQVKSILKKRKLNFTRENTDNMLEIIGIFFCEVIGTSIFIFLGCLGCVEGAGIEKNHIINALCFGMAVFIGTQIFYRGSGGHLNPSVTLISLFFKHMNFYKAILYFFAQIIGALIGFGILKLILPEELTATGSYEKNGLCTTVPMPNLPIFSVMAIEFFMTFFLGLIVSSFWDSRNSVSSIANVSYGLVYSVLTYAGLAFTGGSMNPVRSFAPAVWNNSWEKHWVYWIVPIFASIFSGYFYTKFYGPECYRREN